LCAVFFSRLYITLFPAWLRFCNRQRRFLTLLEGSGAGFFARQENKLNSILISAQFKLKLWS
jgi:hypothetical protein